MKRELLAEVDRRANHVTTSVAAGDNHEDIAHSQSQALLQAWSNLRGLGLDTVNEVCDYIMQKNVWNRTQTSAFAASLRAAASRRSLGKRDMQTHTYLEFYFTGDGWERLCASETPNVTLCQDIVASRVHSFGMVCCDAFTLKRATAIVEHCSQYPPTEELKLAWTREVKDKLKKLDKERPWLFDYTERYPRSPLELPQYVLDHAYGTGVQPVQPPLFSDVGIRSHGARHTIQEESSTEIRPCSAYTAG